MDVFVLGKLALSDYIDGNTTRDEAIQAFKDAVASAYPEITVEEYRVNFILYFIPRALEYYSAMKLENSI